MDSKVMRLLKKKSRNDMHQRFSLLFCCSAGVKSGGAKNKTALVI